MRRARECAHCERIKAALSPNAVPGAHESPGVLGEAEVELVHRVTSDPGRLSEKWSQSVLARGLAEGEYVEIVGLAAMVMMMDTCMRALGLPEAPLPAPRPGEPTRYRPAGAKKQATFISSSDVFLSMWTFPSSKRTAVPVRTSPTSPSIMTLPWPLRM